MIVDIDAVLRVALDHEIISSVPDDPKVKQKLVDTILESADRNQLNGKASEAETALIAAATKKPDKDEALYQSLIEAQLEEGLPIPPEIEGDPPVLPLDLTDLPDKRLRILHGAFQSCAARARWLYSLEEAGEAAAKQIADHHEEEYIITCDRKDIGGKPKPMKLLQAEAKKADPEIVKWRTKEKTHAQKANKYKRITETYTENVDRLSREYTMRENERKN